MVTMSARLMLVGNGSEGTGPALSLSVMRVAEYSREETPLLQVCLCESWRVHDAVVRAPH